VIHPELAELWERSEYAAGYGARLSAIPKSEAAHYCWRVGWDDADTELPELEGHKKVLVEGGFCPCVVFAALSGSVTTASH
jgi:hypothetical protein